MDLDYQQAMPPNKPLIPVVTVREPKSTVAPAPRLLLTADEAAECLAISPRSLWELTKNGDVKSVRVGKGAVRYAVSELRRFVRRLSA
jgi:excisionase family DNA binding protein